MLNVTVRADASKSIGTGHLIRCLTLAHSLREIEASVSFVCREHDGHLCDLIEKNGFFVARLPPANVNSDWREDADFTKAAIQKSGVQSDWLVVDHYELDCRWEGVVRSAARQIMVIDDVANRRHDCDLLLDQNLVARMETRYTDLLPLGCRTLLGPRYALLQDDYRRWHESAKPRRGPIRRILVFFGSGDTHNLTGKAIASILAIGRSDIEVDVVLVKGHPFADTILRQVEGAAQVHVHCSLPSLAPLMMKADLAIGASGATTWERLCLGLPTLVVSLAENQRPIAEELGARGLIRWLGHHDLLTGAGFDKPLRELLAHEVDAIWSEQCLRTVDGRGALRIRAALVEKTFVPLRARDATTQDEAVLLEWANDPATRANAFHPQVISGATHREWLKKRLELREACRLYIVESARGVPLGQVRFERAGDAWEVHYALSPKFRGLGLAHLHLRSALEKLRSCSGNARIFGRVKSDNVPSRKAFELLAFMARPSADGTIIYETTQ